MQWIYEGLPHHFPLPKTHTKLCEGEVQLTEHFLHTQVSQEGNKLHSTDFEELSSAMTCPHTPKHYTYHVKSN